MFVDNPLNARLGFTGLDDDMHAILRARRTLCRTKAII